MFAQSSTAAGSFLNTNLKRVRSGELPRRPGEIPRLPDIGADLVLEVYTHESLRPANKTAENISDNKRLYQLGRRVLNTTVTLILFGKKPLLSAEEIEGQKEKLLCDIVIQGWVKAYQMTRRIRAVIDISRLQAPEECRTVFCAYVGAVYVHSGQEGVHNWISQLIAYQEQQSPSIMETPPAKKIKNEPSLISFASGPPMSSAAQSSQTQTYSPTSPYLSQPQSYPSTYPARQPPPHMNKPAFQSLQPQQMPQFQQVNALFQSLAALTQSRSMLGTNRSPLQQAQSTRSPVRKLPSPAVRPNPLAPATPNTPFLPLFNQTAAQRGVKVDYPADFSGPAHAGQWTVRCVVNGILKGEGKGSSKQVAKEEAARQAYYAMGWT